jgi:hypothetical protein
MVACFWVLRGAGPEYPAGARNHFEAKKLYRPRYRAANMVF